MACKKRMKNFTDEECAALAEAVHQVKDILFGKLTNVITSKKNRNLGLWSQRRLMPCQQRGLSEPLNK